MPRVLAIVAAVLLALAVGAFWPQYLGRPFATIDRYTHVHAALGLVWLVLLVLQPLTIRSRRLAVHRALGRTTWVVAPAFVVSGLLLAHHRFAAMDEQKLTQEAFWLYLPLFVVTLFAGAWGLGLRHRRDPEVHARFMACTGLLIIDPVLGRLMAFTLPPFPADWLYQLITFSMTDGLFAALIAFRRRPGESRSALWVFLAVMVAAQAPWFTLVRGEAWRSFARWFCALPLT